ncbi:MAG: peptidase S24, partial [Pseudomonadota bacterium]
MVSTDGDQAAAVRARLDELIRSSGGDYTSISRMLGRNAAYIQQFIKRGVPKKLDEDDRRQLAAHFGVEERELGGPPSRGGRAVTPGEARAQTDYMLVPYYSAIGASAGAGALSDEEEAAESALAFQVRWVKEITGSDPNLLSVINVQGD